MPTARHLATAAAAACLALPAAAFAVKPPDVVDPGDDPVASAQCLANTAVAKAGYIVEYGLPRIMCPCGPTFPYTICGVTVLPDS